MTKSERHRKQLRRQILLCSLIGFLCPVMRTLWLGPPAPFLHDEFSYLLAAETFALGRLANPSPPAPEFFESIHILVEPAYQSKYPPGGPLLMAAGICGLGHPLWGVWIQSALFGGAFCWLMQVVGLRCWAMGATLFAVAVLTPRSMLGHSYFPALACCAAAAAFFGGLQQTFRRQRVRTSIALALGVCGLAITRPFEGGLVCLGCVPQFAKWLWGSRAAGWRQKFYRVLLPGAAIVGATGILLAVYNHHVTGSWRKMPYALHHAQYFHEGLFVFQQPQTPTRTPAPRVAQTSRDFHRYAEKEIATPLVQRTWRRLSQSFNVALGLPERSAAFALAFPWLLWGLCSRRLRPFLPSFLLWLLGVSVTTWHLPWYATPILPLFYVAMTEPLNQIRSLRRGLRLCPGVSPSVAAVVAVGTLLTGGWVYLRQSEVLQPRGAAALTARFVSEVQLAEETDQQWHPANLPQLRRWFEALPDRHLIFVRYDADYTNADEWVYNHADLPASRMLIVHDLGEERNQALIQEHPDRQVWTLHVAKPKPTLKRQGRDG